MYGNSEFYTQGSSHIITNGNVVDERSLQIHSHDGHNMDVLLHVNGNNMHIRDVNLSDFHDLDTLLPKGKKNRSSLELIERIKGELLTPEDVAPITILGMNSASSNQQTPSLVRHMPTPNESSPQTCMKKQSTRKKSTTPKKVSTRKKSMKSMKSMKSKKVSTRKKKKNAPKSLRRKSSNKSTRVQSTLRTKKRVRRPKTLKLKQSQKQSQKQKLSPELRYQLNSVQDS